MRKLIAGITLTVTLVTAASASAATPRLSNDEAYGAAVTISPGRTLELARTIDPDTSNAMIVVPTSRSSRIGRRAVLVNAQLWITAPNWSLRHAQVLVRKRLSGRVVVRLIPGRALPNAPGA